MPREQSIAAAVDAALFAALLLSLKVLGGIVVVLGLSAFGWSISSLHVLAGWTDGVLVTRLEIVKGILASLGAGTLVALAGLYYEMPIVLICIGVFSAGLAGEKFLRPFSEQVLGRISSIIHAALGRGNGTPPSKP